MKKMRLLLCLCVLASFFWLWPAMGEAVSVDCDAGGIIQDAINAAAPWTLISVSGTCNENVSIEGEKIGITLDGGGTAIISGPDATSATVAVIGGREITVQGFQSITGGSIGISIHRGNALIDSNIIENVANDGISVLGSFAAVINCTIQNNGGNGISVTENGAARIGFLNTGATDPSPNIIQQNGSNGIEVTRFSSARIVGNTISKNTYDGVKVDKASQADISYNTINANGQNGVNVSQNSGINLGNDTGTTIFDLPNNTFPIPPLSNLNGKNGIRCSIGAYVDGRRGGLRGVLGRISAVSGCINSTKP